MLDNIGDINGGFFVIKAAFVGAHSTGKTTLLNEISKLYMDIPVISEIARNMGDIPTRKTLEFTKWQWDILEEQVAHERIYSTTGFLSDRSTLDNLAYYSLGNRDCQFMRGMYWRKALDNMQNYTHVFYVPIEFGLKDDGYRDVDVKYQFMIDVFIQKIIAQERLDVIRVSGCVDNRVATVNHALQRWLDADCS